MKRDRIDGKDNTKDELRIPKNFWVYFVIFVICMKAAKKILQIFFNKHGEAITGLLGMKDIGLAFVIFYSCFVIIAGCCFYKFYMKKLFKPNKTIQH